MLFTTPEQFVVLGMLLLGGLLIGFASAPSPKKWKRRVREQSDSFSDHYAALEEQLHAANRRAADLKAQNDTLRADHAAAERTIASLRAAAVPVAAIDHPEPAVETPTEVVDEAPKGALATEDTFQVAENPAAPPEAAAPLSADPAPNAEAVPIAEPVAPMTPVPTDAPPAAIGPAEPEMPSKGWFASSARDDLTRLRGIDGVLNTRLFSLGVTRFEDLEKLSAEDEMALEQRLTLPVGYIAREQWRTQAALLRAGQTEEHAAHFGAEPALAD